MHVARLRLAALVAGVLAAGPASAFSITVRPNLAAYQDTLVPASGQVDPTAASSTTYIDEMLATVSTIACATGATPGTCKAYAPAGSTVVLQWTSANANTVFAGWTGCNSAVGTTCTVNVTTSNRAVTANFKPATYEVAAKTYPAATATWTPPYGGSVATVAAGIDCRTGAAVTDCSGSAPSGAAVVLTASPDGGSRVKSWSGCIPAAPNATTCTLAAFGPTAVAVAFEGEPTGPQLVTAQVSGTGTVTSGTSGQTDYMNCKDGRLGVSDCSAFAAYGTNLVLTAVPPGGGKLAGWSGCTTASGLTCTVSNVTAAKAVSAAFKSATCNACHGLPPESHGIALQGRGCGECHPGYTNDSVNAATHANGTVQADPSLVKHTVFTAASLATVSAGPQVTKSCVLCHKTQANDVLGSMHFTWQGTSAMTGQTKLGKRNLINDFCVSIPSSESRCLQCHPSFGQPPVKDSNGVVQVNTGPMYNWLGNPAIDKSRIDCLVCHTNLGISKYTKSPAGFGQPWPANPGSCFPACSAAQFCATTDSAGAAWSDGLAHCRAPTQAEKNAVLQAAPQNILTRVDNGGPARTNCGICHFSAGGGDNVKMGDLGSALKAPTKDIDVHMGSLATLGQNKTCADCHTRVKWPTGAGHDLAGAGLTIPIDQEGRLACTDCHPVTATTPHITATTYNGHAAWIGCQTCHIPTFSRTQYTKVNWDWQTAGNKQSCQGVTGCVGFGSLTYPAGNAQTGTIAGVGGEAPSAAYTPGAGDPDYASTDLKRGYDWKKGVSTYARNVTPTYRWFDQTGWHAATDNSDFTAAGTPEDPVVLSGPNGFDSITGKALVAAKIYPFKKMRGSSPALQNKSAMVAPHVFGDDGFWTADTRGFPVVPNTLGSTGGATPNPWDQTKANTIWTGVLNYGAAIAGQLGPAVAKVSVAGMTRDATHLITVNTQADLPATMPANLFLIGAEAAFPTGLKAVTKTGPRQFTYTEAIPYTVNTGQPALPALPATSTKPVAFFAELPAWQWVNTNMYVNLNHEVAPKANALVCANCHPSMGSLPSRMQELYNLNATCPDPACFQLGTCPGHPECSKIH